MVDCLHCDTLAMGAGGGLGAVYAEDVKYGDETLVTLCIKGLNLLYFISHLIL